MLFQSALAICSGAVVGLLLGATGGGGSLIAIPLLVYVVGLPVQNATAISLVVVGYSALLGAWQESRRGQVRGLAAVLFSSTGMVGAWIGAHGHQLVQGEVVLLLFGVLLLIISLWTFMQDRTERDDLMEEGCVMQFSMECAAKALAIGFGVGLLTGFFGIGGGFVIVPALIYFMAFPVRLAIGTSFLIIALTSLGGIAGHLEVGEIPYLLTALLIVGSFFGMMVGSRIARTMNEQTLRRAFGLLAGATGLFLVVDNSMRLFV